MVGIRARPPRDRFAAAAVAGAVSSSHSRVDCKATPRIVVAEQCEADSSVRSARRPHRAIQLSSDVTNGLVRRQCQIVATLPPVGTATSHLRQRGGVLHALPSLEYPSGLQDRKAVQICPRCVGVAARTLLKTSK